MGAAIDHGLPGSLDQAAVTWGRLEEALGLPAGGSLRGRGLSFDDPGAALIALADARALLGSRPPLRPRLALGCGPGWEVGPERFGEEASLVLRLATRIARPGELVCTPAFRACLAALPEGIGIFDAPQDRAAAAGSPFAILGDYRGDGP